MEVQAKEPLDTPLDTKQDYRLPRAMDMQMLERRIAPDGHRNRTDHETDKRKAMLEAKNTKLEAKNGCCDLSRDDTIDGAKKKSAQRTRMKQGNKKSSHHGNGIMSTDGSNEATNAAPPPINTTASLDSVNS
ncbi:uncharacterized protein LOC135341770 [Halichondria panicea]|uniref:uncharacterized protein LOC135341770 n=1 Tax=Halichondria panicea TaxID=6063 RepID=UPI00312B748D